MMGKVVILLLCVAVVARAEDNLRTSLVVNENGSSEEAPSPLRVEGLVAAVFTPFTTDKSEIKFDAIEKQAKYLQSTGVEYAFVGGTTGESVLMTTEERINLTSAWVKISNQHDLKVIVHVGAEASVDAIRLGKDACNRKEVVAFAAMPPSFFRPATPHALATLLGEIALSCPSKPFYYYHIPSMSNVIFPMIDLLKAVESVVVPNFAGIKYTGLYTSPGFSDVQRCLNHNGGKYEILSGRDEMMLEALVVGVKGFVGSQYNFAGDIYSHIIKDFPANLNRARATQSKAIELIDLWQSVSGGGVNGNKVLMSLRLPDIGPSRLPYAEPSPNATSELAKALQTWCAAWTDWTPAVC